MSFLTVFFFTRGIREDVVGEMVILVDEEINLLTSVKACLTQIVELFNATVLFVELFFNSNWQVCSILVTKRVETSIAMCIHRTSVVAQVCIYHCKVEVHDKILVAVWRWVLAYIQVVIKSFELICCVNIIVVAEHRHG